MAMCIVSFNIFKSKALLDKVLSPLSYHYHLSSFCHSTHSINRDENSQRDY